MIINQHFTNLAHKKVPSRLIISMSSCAPVSPSITLVPTENYYANSPISNPMGVDPSITEYRVMRGGSWNWTFGYGRAAYRLWYGKDDKYDAVGFRCAVSE